MPLFLLPLPELDILLSIGFNALLNKLKTSDDL